jgi:hypothetical protein
VAARARAEFLKLSESRALEASKAAIVDLGKMSGAVPATAAKRVKKKKTRVR